MTTLAASRRLVKPSRRRSTPFGYGLAPERMSRVRVSDADRAWASQHLNADARDYCLAGQDAPPTGPLTVADLDAIADLDAAQARYESGLAWL